MPRPPRAPFAVVTIALSAAILAVYGLELGGDGMGLCGRFGFVASRPSFEAAVTSLFLHDPSTVVHVGGNLAVLVLVGARVEREIGSTRFAALCLAGGSPGRRCTSS